MLCSNSVNMSKLSGYTLFLVASPFQCLCMMEAINYFNIDEYDVLVTYSDDYSLNKIDILLRKNHISYTKKKIAHLFYDIMPILFSRHRYYRNIFIGDFYFKHRLVLSYIFATFKAKIFYLDDGVQALQFFSFSPRKINYKIKIKIVLAFYELIRLFKFIKKPVFFTIFNVSSSKYRIIKNPFVLLKTQELEEPRGVYIIGTNSSVLEFKDYKYSEYLNALYNQISERFPEDSIYYCPHRRDQNLTQIFSQCKKLNIEIFNTTIAVEYDFVEKNINPKLIVGFTSNALYTLRMIYPNATVETVMYHLQSEASDKETQIIRSRMIEYGISTINVL